MQLSEDKIEQSRGKFPQIFRNSTETSTNTNFEAALLNT